MQSAFKIKASASTRSLWILWTGTLVVVITVCIASFAFLPAAASGSGADEKKEPPQGAANVANDFGLRLFARLVQQSSGHENMLFSPLSLAICYSIVIDGASGKTRDELAQVMTGAAETATSMQPLYAASLSNPSDVQLSVASAAFAENVNFQSAFASKCQKDFGALVTSFSNDSEAAAELKNWISEKTHGKIKDADVALSPNQFLILNAVYFKADWTDQFTVGQTTDAQFHLPDGTARQVKMMHKYFANETRYGTGDGVQMIRLPYSTVGGEYAMYLFLPPQGRSPETFVANLSDSVLAKYIAGMTAKKGALSVPRFRLKEDVSLKQALTQLGVKQAWSGETADFSKMVSTRGCWLHDINQKAVLTTNEKGTEASVLTTAMFPLGIDMDRPFEMNVDRPFAFVLRDDRSQAILFLGIVNEPLAEAFTDRQAHDELVKKARECLRQANLAKPSHLDWKTRSLLSDAAQSFLMAGEYEECIAIYKREIAIGTSEGFPDTLALRNLADLYHKRGDGKNELLALRQLLNANEYEAWPKGNRGASFEMAGWKTAVEEYTALLRRLHMPQDDAIAANETFLKGQIQCELRDKSEIAVPGPSYKVNLPNLLHRMTWYSEQLNTYSAKMDVALKNKSTILAWQEVWDRVLTDSRLGHAQEQLADFYVGRQKNELVALGLFELAMLNCIKDHDGKGLEAILPKLIKACQRTGYSKESVLLTKQAPEFNHAIDRFKELDMQIFHAQQDFKYGHH